MTIVSQILKDTTNYSPKCPFASLVEGKVIHKFPVPLRESRKHYPSNGDGQVSTQLFDSFYSSLVSGIMQKIIYEDIKFHSQSR